MSITITAENLKDLQAQVAALSGGAAAADAGETTSTGRGRGKKNTDEATDKKGADTDDGPTVEEIRELASKIETDEGQDKAIAALEDAGVESISALGKKSAAVRQKFLDAIKAIVEGKKSRRALD